LEGYNRRISEDKFSELINRSYAVIQKYNLFECGEGIRLIYLKKWANSPHFNKELKEK